MTALKRNKEPLGVQKAWFERIINEKFGSSRNFAKFLGMDASALNLLLNSKRDVRVREAYDIADGLGQPVTEIMLRLGVPVRHGAATVPVIGEVSDKGIVTAHKGGIVTAPGGLPDDAVAVCNRDPKSFRYGWTYFYTARGEVPREAIGRLCVVKLPNGQQRLRHVILAPGSADNYTLISENGVPDGDHELESASPVIWVKV